MTRCVSVVAENQAAAAAVRQARSGEGAGGGGGEPKQAPSTLGRAAGIWSRASAKLFSLEARIRDQVRGEQAFNRTKERTQQTV